MNCCWFKRFGLWSFDRNVCLYVCWQAVCISEHRNVQGNAPSLQCFCSPGCAHRYCECFASGKYCDGCNCVNCFNNKENEATRSTSVEAIMERNPNAFRAKIQVRKSGVPSTTLGRITSWVAPVFAMLYDLPGCVALSVVRVLSVSCCIDRSAILH